jgi:alpha-methylacyl-CoA racemase
MVTANGVDQAAPAPRFSRTPPGPPASPPKATTTIGEINW